MRSTAGASGAGAASHASSPDDPAEEAGLWPLRFLACGHDGLAVSVGDRLSGMRACILPRMPAHGVRRHLVFWLLLIVLLAVAVVAVGGMSAGLMLAPAALLALPLLFRCYLGERVIHRLARRVVLARPERSVVLPRAPRSLGARVAALAVPGSGRAPPGAALI